MELVRYSPVNVFLIARKFARKILADYHAGWGGQDSCDASDGILVRNSREFFLFAERMRGFSDLGQLFRLRAKFRRALTLRSLLLGIPNNGVKIGDFPLSVFNPFAVKS